MVTRNHSSDKRFIQPPDIKSTDETMVINPSLRDMDFTVVGKSDCDFLMNICWKGDFVFVDISDFTASEILLNAFITTDYKVAKKMSESARNDGHVIADIAELFISKNTGNHSVKIRIIP